MYYHLRYVERYALRTAEPSMIALAGLAVFSLLVALACYWVTGWPADGTVRDGLLLVGMAALTIAKWRYSH